MSCQHGNRVGDCELCEEVDTAWDNGYKAGVKKAAEMCEAYIVSSLGKEMAEAIRKLLVKDE
jgi:hypothetical protein